MNIIIDPVNILTMANLVKSYLDDVSTALDVLGAHLFDNEDDETLEPLAFLHTRDRLKDAIDEVNLIRYDPEYDPDIVVDGEYDSDANVLRLTLSDGEEEIPYET